MSLCGCTDDCYWPLRILVFRPDVRLIFVVQTGIKLMNVLFFREISTDSFCDPNGSHSPLMNEMLLDKCVCLPRVKKRTWLAFDHFLPLVPVHFPAAQRHMALICICGETKRWGSVGWLHFVSELHPLYAQHLDKHPGATLSPIDFCRGPSLAASVALHVASKVESRSECLLAFMYSLRSQSKQQKLWTQPAGDLSETGLVPFHPLWIKAYSRTWIENNDPRMGCHPSIHPSFPSLHPCILPLTENTMAGFCCKCKPRVNGSSSSVYTCTWWQ